MRFGLFGSAQADAADQRHGRGFHDYADFNVEAEALGFHSTFLVEHHFSGWSQVSATLTLLTWLAARTTTLRLGTATLVLPWHNPVLLAEQAATLDLLSGGRVDFGVGKGYRHNEFAGFSIPIEEAEPRFDEALTVILRAWTTAGRFSHNGRFWRFEDIAVEPLPAQKPHPPVWVAAGSPRAIRRVAERGANLLLDQFAPPQLIGERIALFRAEVRARGRTFDPLQVAVARDVFVAEDPAEKAAALRRRAEVNRRTVAVSRAPGGSGGSHILSYADAPGGTEASALYGTADEVIEGLRALEAVGVRYVLMNIGGGSRESLRRIARDVLPQFAGANATRAGGGDAL